MVLHVLRALFVLLMAAVGWYFINQQVVFGNRYDQYYWLALMVMLTVGVLIVCIDILRRAESCRSSRELSWDCLWECWWRMA